MEAEVNVFLRCLSCGTFITSSSIEVVRKHIEKCSSEVEMEFVALNDVFIRKLTQPITFTQPSVVLASCSLEQRSNSERVSKLKLPVSKSISRKKCQNKRKRASNQIQLEAIKKPKLCVKPQLETKMKLFVVSSDKDLKMGASKSDINSPNIPKIWFWCDLCSAKYTTEVALTRHKNNIHVGHTGETFTCSICYRMLKYRRGPSGLQGHLLRHQEAEALEKQLNLWKKWPMQPNRQNGQIIYNCKYCLMNLTNHTNFLSHMVTDHSDQLEHSLYHCPYNCSAQLDSISELIAHFKCSHPHEYFGSSHSGNVINDKRHLKQEKCDQCGRFFNKKYIAKHKKIKHSHTNAVKRKPEGYCCAYPGCEIKCQNTHHLRRHFILHLEKCPFACNFPNCSVKCGSPCDLKRHIQRKHLDAPITCTTCGVTSSNTERLKRHDCDGNVKKLQSGNYELEEVNGVFKLTLAEFKKENGVKSRLARGHVSATSVKKYDLADKVDQYVESLKQVDVNAVIRSDPGFIKACQNSPGFGQLLLGYDYFREKNPQPEKKRHRLNPTLGANETLKVLCEYCGKDFADLYCRKKHIQKIHGVTIPLPGAHFQSKGRSKKQKMAKAGKTISKLPKFPVKTEQAIVQVKIEPELTILPELIVTDDDLHNYDLDLIVKQEIN